VDARQSAAQNERVLGNLIGPEIKELIEARNFAALRGAFEGWAPADIAECITELPEDQQAVVFRILPHDVATEVLEYLDADAQQVVLKAMGHAAAARILNDMSPDDRTALLEELPGAAVAQLLTLLSPEEKAVAQTLLNYPEGSVGRLMTPDFISVRGGWTIQQVLDYIRKNGEDSETLNVIYVTDERGRLVDDVRIREILLRPLETRVADIHDNSFVALRATDAAEMALGVFRKYDRNTLPVIDSEEKLLGIVTIDDMLDVQEEETTEDMQKIGGMQALDVPYMEASIMEMVRKRAIWLIILFLGQMLTMTVMGTFQSAIEKAVVLSLFIPLIISSGGNSGSQASTLIIRAMALGQITLGDWWRVMKRKCDGLLLGGLLGTIGFLRIGCGRNSRMNSIRTVAGGPHCGISSPGGGALGHDRGIDVATLCCGGAASTRRPPPPVCGDLVDVTGLVITLGSHDNSARHGALTP
jgi:magnesium transporter